MSQDDHYLELERMYRNAPINRIYQPRVIIRKGHAEIEMEISENCFHPAGAVHGSVYFKMLDDAAFFAANSLEREVFMLTTTFTTYLTRPVSSGVLKSVGKVVNTNNSQIIAESVVYNSDGNEIGRGNGLFVRSNVALDERVGYGGK